MIPTSKRSNDSKNRSARDSNLRCCFGVFYDVEKTTVQLHGLFFMLFIYLFYNNDTNSLLLKLVHLFNNVSTSLVVGDRNIKIYPQLRLKK